MRLLNSNNYICLRKEKDFTVDFSLMRQTDGLATNQAVFAELPDGAEVDIETLKKSVCVRIYFLYQSSCLF